MSKDVSRPTSPEGPHYLWSTELPIRRQAEFVLKKIEITLNAAGTSLANCVKAQVHVAGAENFPDFLDVWNAHVGDSPAALTMTPAKAFSAVEIVVSINYLLLKDGAERKKEIVHADIPELAAYSRRSRRRIRVQSGPVADDARGNGGWSRPKAIDFQGLCLRSQLQANPSTTMPKRSRKPPAPRHAQCRPHRLLGERHSRIPGRCAGLGGALRSAPHPFACVVTPRLPAPGATVMADFWFYAG